MGCSVSKQRSRKRVTLVKVKEGEVFPILPAPETHQTNGITKKAGPVWPTPLSPPKTFDKEPETELLTEVQPFEIQPKVEPVKRRNDSIVSLSDVGDVGSAQPNDVDDEAELRDIRISQIGNQSRTNESDPQRTTRSSSNEQQNQSQTQQLTMTTELSSVLNTEQELDDFHSSDTSSLTSHRRRFSSMAGNILSQTKRSKSFSSRRRSSTFEKVAPFLSKINRNNPDDQIPPDLVDIEVNVSFNSLCRFSLSQPLKMKRMSSILRAVPEPSIRLCIISPSKGIYRERKKLHKILSNLEVFCMERRIFLKVVDCHAFTEIPPLTNQVSLDFSLREVRKSDYFLFIIGKKYGWVPDLKDEKVCSLRVQSEYPVLLSYPNSSNIEYELRTAFIKSDNMKRGYTFFKESDSSSEDLGEVRKISELKFFVTSEIPPHPVSCSEYNNPVDFLDAFAEKFKQDLSSDFPLNVTPVEFDILLNNINSQICKKMVHTFRGRARLLQELFSVLDSLSGIPLLYSGPPGIGKTALMSKLYSLLDKDRSFIHYIGHNVESTNVEVMLSRILTSLGINHSTEEQNILTDFLDLMVSHFKLDNPYIVIIDDIDRLDTSFLNTDWMSWIPNPLPRNFKMIITCSQEFASSQELSTNRFRYLEAMSLEWADVEKIAQDQISSQDIQLPPSYFSALGQNLFCQNPLFLNLLLVKIRMAYSNNNQDCVADCIQRKWDIISLIRSLFDDFVNYFTKTNYSNFVLETLSVLSLSKTGFRERDLQCMFEVPYCIWSPFFTALSEILCQNEDKYTFANQIVCSTAYSWCFQEPHIRRDSVAKVSSKIQDYFWPLLSHLDSRSIMNIIDMHFTSNQLQFVRDILLHKQASLKVLDFPVKTLVYKIWKILQDSRIMIDGEYEKMLNEEWDASFGLKVARLYIAINNYEAAIKVLERVVSDEEMASGDDYIYSLIDLSKLYLQQELYQKCIEYYEKVLKLMPDIFLPNQVDYESTCLDSYALALGNLGRHSESHDTIQKALDIRVQNYGDSHISVAHSYNNLGLHYTRCGKYEESNKAHQKSIVILLQVLHKEHPDIALVQSNLASALLKNENYSESDKIFRLALRTLETKRGKNHPDVAAIMDHLGVICTKIGKPKQSFDYHLKALSIYQQVYGHKHLCLSGVFVNLAIASKDIANYPKCEGFLTLALEIEKNHSSEENNAMASIMFNMGLLFLAQRQPEKALPLFEDSMRIRGNVIGESTPEYLTSLRYVASTLNEIGRVEETIRLFLRLASLQKEHFGEDLLSLATTYFNIGVLYYDLEQDKEALEYFNKSYDLQITKLNGIHPDAQETNGYIAELTAHGNKRS